MALPVQRWACLPHLNHNNHNHHQILVLQRMGDRWLMVMMEGWIGSPRIGSTRAIHPRETIRARTDNAILSRIIRIRTGIFTTAHHLALVPCQLSAWVTVSLRVEGYQDTERVEYYSHCHLLLLLGCHLLVFNGLEVADRPEVACCLDWRCRQSLVRFSLARRGGSL